METKKITKGMQIAARLLGLFAMQDEMPHAIRTYRPGRVRSNLAKHRSQRQRRRDYRRRGVYACRKSGKLFKR